MAFPRERSSSAMGERLSDTCALSTILNRLGPGCARVNIRPCYLPLAGAGRDPFIPCAVTGHVRLGGWILLSTRRVP